MQITEDLSYIMPTPTDYVSTVHGADFCGTLAAVNVYVYFDGELDTTTTATAGDEIPFEETTVVGYHSWVLEYELTGDRDFSYMTESFTWKNIEVIDLCEAADNQIIPVTLSGVDA